MSRPRRTSLSDLDRYLKMTPAQIHRALWRAEDEEERRSGVFHKYRIPDPYERLRAQLAALLCDRRTGSLKDWAQELVDGEIRDLAVAILTLACSHLHVALSLAVPFAALVAKRGLKGLCESQRATKRKTSRGRR